MKSIIWLFCIWPIIFSGDMAINFFNSSSCRDYHLPDNPFGSVFLNTQPSIAQQFDILINEIMPDPSPAVLLPEYEYAELFNRSGYPVNLAGWSFEVGNKAYSLKGELEPGGYIILTHTQGVPFFREYGNVLGIFTSLTALANTGQTLILRDHNREIIDVVQYDDKWYGDSFKMKGGWSLERIDPGNACAGRENWTASVSVTGGTPGKLNSVNAANPDLLPPYITGVQLISDYEINILFNESIDRTFFAGDSPFTLTQGNNAILELIPSLPFLNSCILTLRDKLTHGKIFEVTASRGFRDCAGNIPPGPVKVRFGKPLAPGFTDIILTEVLYAPFPACAEFIEIYNNTEDMLDLSEVIIGLNYGNNEDIKREYIVNEQFLFFPGEYLVISSDPESLGNFYDILYPERLFRMVKMPVLRDAGGCIELTDRSFQLLDRYCYSGKAQYPLLNDDKGVSLERMNISRSPGFLSHWHSASSLSGFATPGYANSQSIDILSPVEMLSIEPKTFTPDNDGKDDVTVISFSITGEGYTGNIIIFDASGRKIRHLARNELLGFSGHFIWDGTDDRGQLCGTGIYLVFFDAFDLKGGRVRKKGTVVLVRR